MAIGGWVGLWLLVTTALPTAFPRWLFFRVPLPRGDRHHAAVRALPEYALRWAAWGAASVILRQSIWIGLFAVACAWLQIPRVLNPVIAACWR
jgi:hypothetical protein